MDYMKEIILKEERKKRREFENEMTPFNLQGVATKRVIRKKKRYAKEILSGPDTVYLNIRSLRKEDDFKLNRNNSSLVERIDDTLEKAGFSRKYVFNSVIRWENDLGFVVVLGKTAKFLKREILRLSKEGESSIYKKTETFRYFNEVRKALGKVLREFEITPSERVSRIDIFRDFVTRGLFGVIQNGSIPLQEARGDLNGPLMKHRKYYDRKNSRAISGIKFFNTSTSLVAYSKSLEVLQKSDNYRDFYKNIQVGKGEEIVRVEVKQLSTFALNALYPEFLDAINETDDERMLQKLESLEAKAFNGFINAHPFVLKNGKKDEYIDKLLRKETTVCDYQEVERLLSSFSNLTYREIFSTPAERSDIIKVLTKTFLRLNLDPAKLTKGDLAEIRTEYKIKKRRKQLKEGDVLKAQRLSALLIAHPEDIPQINEFYDRAYSRLKYDMSA